MVAEELSPFQSVFDRGLEHLRLRSPGRCFGRCVLVGLAAARQGEAHALGQLFELYRPYLVVIAEAETPQRLRSKYSPDDAVQDTLLIAVEAFAGFRGTTSNEIASWLRRILRHQLITIARYFTAAKRQIAKEIPLDKLESVASRPVKVSPDLSPPDLAMQRQEELDRVDTARGRLPARHARVLVLRDDQCLSYVKVGAHLGISPDAARKLHRRALLQLRALLQRHLATQRQTVNH
jgi:RNA polymerase sigma-70 factor (subfamily 1)